MRWVVAGLPPVAAGAAAVAATGAVYVIAATALGVTEIRDVARALAGRLRRS
jgi:hypothetical protein